jgi:ribosomal protein S18 acetylase RimI-like enzyme
MNWRISQPNEDDLIVDMCLALNREDPGPRPVAVHQIRNTLMELRTNPLRGIIAVLDLEGRVEGYALLVAYWSNELGGEICNVDEIYVRPGWRRHGYGRALVEALVAGNSVWPRHPAAIAIEVNPTNEQALALYSKLGFVRSPNLQMLLRRVP